MCWSEVNNLPSHFAMCYLFTSVVCYLFLPLCLANTLSASSSTAISMPAIPWSTVQAQDPPVFLSSGYFPHFCTNKDVC